MRVTWQLNIPNGEFKTDNWKNEVRDIIKTYFVTDIESTFLVEDIPSDADECGGGEALYDSVDDEFDPQ